MKVHTLLVTAAALFALPAARAADQTPDFTPVELNSKLPYTISVDVHDMGAANVPTLQGMAKGQVGNEWVVLCGRTNGLHNFSNDGLKNFPPADQNRKIWVIDPVSKQTWSRDLSDTSSGLNTAQIDALSVTASQAAQQNNTLYIVGGYGYDTSLAAFQTYPVLTALDLSKVISWVKTGSPSLASTMRQTADEFLRVTGGELFLLGDRAQLVFGQNFTGGYVPGSNGAYTNQVRTFQINDALGGISISNLSAEAPRPEYRRRDLNVVPFMQSGANGSFDTSLVALSGVFTPSNGIWTVPVEINADGTTFMANPSDPSTFRQGMNSYRSSSISLFSPRRNQTDNLLFGGISVQYFDPASGTIASDENVPFINGITSVVRNSSGMYSQTYLGEFPSIPNPTTNNAPFIFGAESDFFPLPDVANFGNGVLNADAITTPTTLGFIYGGIIAELPNNGATAASSLIFTVTLHPIAAPKLKVATIRKREGSSASRLVQGTTTDASAVEWRVNSRQWRTKNVSAKGKWKINARPLRFGKNRVYIRAVNTAGDSTSSRKRTIIRTHD